MKKIIAFILMLSAFMAVFGFSFKIFNKKLDTEKPTVTDFSTLTYAALGDSITAAVDGTLGGDRLMRSPYCELVKDSLGLKSVANYGISGSTVAKGYMPMCERYKEMVDADIVSFMGGTNDWGKGLALGNINDNSADTFYGALNTLANGLKAKYSDSFIFFMTPFKALTYGHISRNDEGFDAYRQAIKDVAAKYDIPVLDTAVLADFSKEFNAVGYSGDGLHPSQDFHKNVLAPVIADFIKTNYKAA